MKIAFLIERLNPARGGAETYSFDFTAGLASEGHEVHAFSRGGSVVPPGVTLHPVKVRGVGRAWRTLSFARGVDKALRREEFDIVHGVGWTFPRDVFQPHGGVHRAMLIHSRMHLGLLRGLAGEFRADFSPREISYRLIERAQYERRSAAVFVAVSRMVKEHMAVFCKAPLERIEVVHNGVDTERFHPRNREAHRSTVRMRHAIADDEVVFLCVAHNFRLKGVPELIRCVTAKDFPPCRLLVVGGGKPGKLRGLARARAPGRVIFTGAVTDTAPYYAAADVYAHHTHYDPCSLVVLEALASGLPVVTSTMNGAAELMTEGVEGYAVEQGAVGEFSERMRALFDDALRKGMGAAARALAEKHTIRHNYLDMMRVYRKALLLKGHA
jgi:UDP-glucose:(heptosyl)LPS alpha-1,3-glucosyltransferase